MIRKAWIGSFVLAVLLSGCAREEVPVPDDAYEEARLQLEQMQSEVRTVADENDMYTALIFGLNQIKEWEPSEVTQEGFAWLTSLAKDTDVLVAQSFVKDVLDIDEQLAGQAVLMLDEHMMEQDPSAWLGFLQDYEMPPRFRTHGFDLWFRYYADEASPLDLAGALMLLQDPTLEGYIEGVFTAHLQNALRNLDKGSFSQVIGLLGARIPRESALYEIVLQVEGKSYLQRGEMAQAFAHYKEHAVVLGDSLLSRVLGQILRHASEADDADLQTEIRTWGYAQEEFPIMRNRLARWDLGQLDAEDAVQDIVHAVREILDHGIPAAVAARGVLHGVFHQALAQADEEGQEGLRDLLLDLLDAESDWDATLKGSIESALLDVFFYLEDFEAALERIEGGIPGYDDDWHAELRNKVQAHLAEQEGRIADAVKHYEKHIERVQSWTEDFVSPEDGRTIVSDEVIALNARRIGDLWASAGETEKAAAAYARAIAHYEVARSAYADDAQSLAIVEAALQELESVER